MQVIIPLREARFKLRQRMVDHAKRYNYEEYGTINEERLVGLLVAMIEDDVSRNLKYPTDPPTRCSDQLAMYYPYWSAEASEQFYTDVMADISDLVTRWLDDYLPQYEWNIWTFSLLGLDVLVDIGQDFRITDWERRVNSGEWK